MTKAAFYIHIPFCVSKCSYCDFYSITDADAELIDKFIYALKTEMQLYSEHPIFSGVEFQTLYFGGGTPSLLIPEQIDEISQYAQRIFRFKENFEFTIEANPETIDQNMLKKLYAIGVNRLSIGVQSFSDLELNKLNRIHNAEQARQCIEWASQTGFENLNIDLMFAIPGQNLSVWLTNLQLALTFHPKHLSIYCLTIEPGTVLDHQIASGVMNKVPEETQRNMYLATVEILSAKGYQHYEVSNFAMLNFECQHNCMYWNWSPYLGIGPSAHSFWQFQRQWNVEAIDMYLKSLETGKRPIADQEELSEPQKMLEFVYLGLRTNQGIDVQEFQRYFGTPFSKKFGSVLNDLSHPPGSELFYFHNNKMKLTPTGLILFDEVCQRFACQI